MGKSFPKFLPIEHDDVSASLVFITLTHVLEKLRNAFHAQERPIKVVVFVRSGHGRCLI